MVFKSVEQFRDVVTYYAIKRGVQVDLVKNDRKRVRVTCSFVSKEGKKCPWLLFASIDRRSGDFIIKNYHPIHQCEKQSTNRHCNAEFISKFLRKDIQGNPALKVWQIQDIIKDRLELYKAKSVCRRARGLVLKEMAGDYKLEFSRLYDYKDCLLQTNPGSTCVIDVTIERDMIGEPTKHIFKGMYVCFHAMKEGFKKGCRKFLGFDGCFLKGPCKGMLLSAVAKNGNNQMYPIAWAVDF